LLFERGFDAAVYGHTHLPEVRHVRGGTFVNGGSWMKGGGDYVRIENGALTLCEWTGRGRL